MYTKEIQQLLQSFLGSLEEAFSRQRGAIYGFGTNANDDTGTVLKIYMADNEKRRKIDHVSHMNLVSERSVVMIRLPVILGQFPVTLLSQKRLSRR